MRRTTAIATMIAAVALALGLASCGRSGTGSGENTEPRYLVLSPAVAVMLRDLGQENRIVARHAYDLVLDESLPVAGELGRIDYEVVLAANPTHILIEWGDRSQPLPDRLTDLARQRNIEVIRFSMLALPDIIDAVDTLERDLPPSDLGPDTGFWQERMRALWENRRQPGQPWPRYQAVGPVLLIAATDPAIGVLGPGSWHHQIVEAVGGVPAVTDGAPWMELTVEDILRLAPLAIILIQPRSPDEASEGIAASATQAEVLERLGPLAGLDIPAVRTGQIALIDDPLAHTPSTAMVGLTQRLEAILASWAAQRERESVLPELAAPAGG